MCFNKFNKIILKEMVDVDCSHFSPINPAKAYNYYFKASSCELIVAYVRCAHACCAFMRLLE